MTDDLISIHTCHAECPRPLCVAQRTIATQQEAIDELVAWLRKMTARQSLYSGGHDDALVSEATSLLSKHGQRT